MQNVFWRRRLLWGLLIASLVAIVGAAISSRLPRRAEPAPPPVLGQVPDFALTNRDGRRIGRAELAGSPWIADFVFTRCASSCPLLTERMAKLGREVPPRFGARFASFSVDPDNDTPAVLEAYARRAGAPEDWLFLTGDRDAMLDLIRNGFKLAVDPDRPPGPEAVAEPILHSTRFVLVDARGQIRGYYDALDEGATRRLKRDLEAVAEPD